MAPLFIQSTTGNGGAVSTVTSTAFTTQPVAGNLIVVALGCDTNTAATTVPTDNAGNIYVRARADVVNATNIAVGLWYAYNILTIASFKVTGNWASTDGTSRALVAQEFSGLALTDPLDRTASGTGNSTAVTTNASAVTSKDNELVIGAASNNAGDTFTAGSGYTNAATGVKAGFLGTGLESQVVSTKAAQTATFTLPFTDIYAAIVATFFAPTQSMGKNVLRPAPFKPGNAR